MQTVIDLISGFPTVIFTVPLLVCLILLLVSMLGLLDLEIFELDIDIATDAGFAGLLATLGLTGIPLTLSLSLLFLFAWSITLFSSAWLLPLINQESIELAVAVALVPVSFMLAVFFTGKLTRPMSRLFITHEACSNTSLINRICTITSLKVDGQFGQAKIEDGGAGLLLSVRCEEPNGLHKGDQALIYEYKEEQNIYYVLKQD